MPKSPVGCLTYEYQDCKFNPRHDSITEFQHRILLYVQEDIVMTNLQKAHYIATYYSIPIVE